jgi:hypothetical protein
MSITPDMLINMTVAALSLATLPTEAEIDAVLDRLTGAFPVDSDIKEQARRTLHARFDIRMDLGSTLLSHDEHMPWLAARRSDIPWFYWPRYRELLLRSGWPPMVLATLDQATDELLDLLGDPAEPDQWKRRGLVMGDVQSGKTATYAALMAKAADAGYRMIILLTGTLENVRRQTQERLDSGFVGFDSRGFLANKGAKHKEHIGVGLIDPRRDGIVFTSSEHDFRKNAASALNISLNAVNEPVLVVAKKNKGILERLEGWLRARNADRDGLIDVPLLLIDDEADNASVNTRGTEDPTSINKGIRALLGLFRRSAYVGFTATPFANIFIDPESASEMVGDDLFPNDFIHVLEAPSNYVGMHGLFGDLDVDDDADAGPLRSIDDANGWIDPADKSAADPAHLPDSLIDALRTFLVACAIRDLREKKGAPGGGGGPHRSMLVNVTHYTAVQNRIANLIHVELDEIRTQVRNYAGKGPDVAAERSAAIAELQRVFEQEFADQEQTWPDVLAQLNSAIGPVRVQPVNASTGAKSLDYRILDGAQGVRVIAVGGNSLSRGLTLEGLSVSYFLRNSRAYDTLLQMGRWFGYRGGYHDLCRVWITAEAQGWYRHIAEATAELKRDFMKMKKRQATPREFGLRVRTHPEALLITARNKMSTGRDIVVATHDLSLMGRQIETTKIYNDRHRSGLNFTQIERLLQRANELKPAGVAPNDGALLWKDVPAALIADFLDEFLVHPHNFDFQADSIAAYLRSDAIVEEPRLATWTIALPLRGEAGQDVEIAPISRAVQTRKRKVREDASQAALLVSGKSARVGGKADVRLGLPAGVTVSSKEEEAKVRECLASPLLVLYLLRGEFKADPAAPAKPYKDGLLLPALGMHFPGQAEDKPPTSFVKYRLNKVGQEQLFAPDAGDDDISFDVDDED